MSASYNLRSLKKKTTSNQKCYLQNIINSKLVSRKNPTVCLKRMEVLERPDSCNNTFYIHNDIIKVKNNKNKISYLPLAFLKFLFLILIGASLVYFKDEIQHVCSEVMKEIPNCHRTISKYYYDASHSHKKYLKQDSDIFFQRIKNKNDSYKVLQNNNSKKCKDQKKLNDNLIKDYIEALNITFIDEQCGKNVEPKEADTSQKNSNRIYTLFQPENLIDYALESKGARILCTFETEDYGAVALKIWNFDFGVIKNSFFQNYFNPRGPSSILVPWKKPGDCWAFKGSRGRVQIKLSEKIIITAVTIDHVTKDISKTQNIKSAPRKFKVIGIEDASNLSKRIYLGTFKYTLPGPPIQTFSVESLVKNPCEVLEIIIESNHGNKYTCLYKVRVHGHK